ncbi:MAG TPA: hypothetical protein VK674_05360 [Candidatus Limnocylindria bacterium]|nr:hypothetical protein [Candidatus Limnocylindria bacterium]
MAARSLRVSTKRIQIDKANSSIVIAVGVAAFAVAFSLVAAKSLIARQSYQNKVITAREQARDQLQANIDAVSDLKTKYTEFVSRQENIINGNSSGGGERDGDNARIILDALPSKYDFPALASSLEKILVDRNYRIQTINGTDNEATQNGSGDVAATSSSAAAAAASSGVEQQTPSAGAAVEMPFEIGAEGSYKGMVELLGVFKNSIRPLYVQTLTFTAGDGSNIQLNILGKTFYQPERTLNIAEEVVK